MKTLLMNDDAGGMREVTNLRPDKDGNLRPVGCPALLKPAQLSPIGALTLNGQRRIISAYGSAIYSQHPSGSSSLASLLPGRLPGVPDCAVALSDSRLLAMTPAGAVAIDASANVAEVRSQPDFDGVCITAQSTGPLQHTVDGMTLGNASESYADFIAKNKPRLVQAAREAYGRLHAEALADGRYFQPVVCGFRLVGKGGNVLFSSGPMLIGGFSLDGSVDVFSDDGLNVKPYSLGIDTWRMHLSVKADSTLASTVSRLEVWVMPQLHTFHPDVPGEVYAARRGSSADAFARIALSAGLSSGQGGAAGAARILRAAASLYTNGKMAYAVSNPFARDLDVNVSAVAELTAERDARASDKLDAGASSSVSVPRDFMPPHSFTARHVARSGDTLLWGNITRLPYKGYPAGMICASRSSTSENWTARTVVTLADGARIYAERPGRGPRPTSIQALVTYPDVQAVSLLVQISWGTSLWTGSFPLSPDPSGAFSYYLSADRKPVEVVHTGGASVIAPEYTPLEYPGMVIAACAQAPLVPMASLEMTDVEVRGVAERGGNDTAWDHVRSRFFIGTRGSVHAMGINLATGKYTLRRVTPYGIRSRSALVCMGEGAGVLMDTPEGTVPAVVGKNGQCRRLCGPMEASALLYNPIRGELTACGSSMARVFCQQADMAWFQRTDIDIRTSMHIDGLPYGTGDAGVTALFHEEPYGGTVPVAVCADSCAGKPGTGRLRRLVLEATGADVAGELTLARTEPDGLEKEQLTKITLSGNLRRGLVMPLYSRPLQGCRWKFCGEVDSSFRFKSLMIDYAEYGCR